MEIDEVFKTVNKKTRQWSNYTVNELGEMLDCAMLHIIALEVHATHLTHACNGLAQSATDELPSASAPTAEA